MAVLGQAGDMKFAAVFEQASDVKMMVLVHLPGDMTFGHDNATSVSIPTPTHSSIPPPRNTHTHTAGIYSAHRASEVGVAWWLAHRLM